MHELYRCTALEQQVLHTEHISGNQVIVQRIGLSADVYCYTLHCEGQNMGKGKLIGE